MTTIVTIGGAATGTTVLNGATSWFIGGGSNSATVGQTTAESRSQTPVRTAGVYSKLWCYIGANTISDASTFTYRVGAANGNQTVSITGSTTGEFTDTSNTDAVSAGNLINLQIVGGATGTSLTLRTTEMVWAPTTTTNTVQRQVANGVLTDTSVNTHYYNPLCGIIRTNTTEASVQVTNKISCTLQNGSVMISANTASVATLKTRKNGADGNISVSITSGGTGQFEDTSNTDSVAVDDLVNTDFVATVVTTITVRNISVEQLTTTGYTHYICGDPSITSIAKDITRYFHAAGDPDVSATEANSNSLCQSVFTTSFMQVYISANTVSATSTITSRKNSGAGNQTFTIGASTTGAFIDSSNSDSYTATDYIGARLVTGATGTSMTPTIFGFLASYGGSSAAVPVFYYHLQTQGIA